MSNPCLYDKLRRRSHMSTYVFLKIKSPPRKAKFQLKTKGSEKEREEFRRKQKPLRKQEKELTYI